MAVHTFVFSHRIHIYIYIHTHTHRSQCEHFNLPPPDFSLVEQLGADIAQQEETWAQYEEFSVSLDTLSAEDWISFR